MRDAKLYFLTYKDWKPIVALVEKNKIDSLKLFITIFQLMSASSKEQYYAIISLHNMVDSIIEEYGCVEANENDLIRTTLHSYSGESLYGDKKNTNFLMKVK